MLELALGRLALAAAELEAESLKLAVGGRLQVPEGVAERLRLPVFTMVPEMVLLLLGKPVLKLLIVRVPVAPLLLLMLLLLEAERVPEPALE